MQERIDALLAAGAQNLWPKFIFFTERTEQTPAKHVVVAEVMDGICVLTADGHALLSEKADIVDAEVVSVKKRAARKLKTEAGDFGAESLDDVDLD
jgi:hypothetical protein